MTNPLHSYDSLKKQQEAYLKKAFSQRKYDSDDWNQKTLERMNNQILRQIGISDRIVFSVFNEKDIHESMKNPNNVAYSDSNTTIDAYPVCNGRYQQKEGPDDFNERIAYLRSQLELQNYSVYVTIEPHPRNSANLTVDLQKSNAEAAADSNRLKTLTGYIKQLLKMANTFIRGRNSLTGGKEKDDETA